LQIGVDEENVVRGEPWGDVVRRLIGLELSSVTFVRDYVQLGFDGPILNAVTLPTIQVGQRQYRSGGAGYRDALCGRIGRVVKNASIREDDAFRMDFDDGTELSISLRPQDYTGAEALSFTDDHGWWVA
jgi:hypothetical protein